MATSSLITILSKTGFSFWTLLPKQLSLKLLNEEEEDHGELEDEFDEYNMGAAPQPNPRLVHTVPAKEPDINAVPLKPALKKPKGSHSNHGSSTSSRNSNHNEKNVVEVQITSNR